MEIQFLNVDLEIEKAESLQSLIDYLGEDVRVYHHGENGSGYDTAYLSVTSPVSEKDADGVIASFCYLIENLSPEVRRVWDGCCKRIFDAGFSSGVLPRSYRTEIRADTIKRVADLGASIVITIYPHDK